MEINKNTLTEFRRDFKEAVASLEEKYGVTISLGSISYSENDFTSKLTVNNGHDKDDIAQREFDRDVWKYAHLGLGKGILIQESYFPLSRFSGHKMKPKLLCCFKPTNGNLIQLHDTTRC